MEEINGTSMRRGEKKEMEESEGEKEGGGWEGRGG